MPYPTGLLRHRYPLFLTGDLHVILQVPADGATVTNAEVDVQWTFAPGAQQSFRVRVWEDAALTTLAYDSGVTASGGMTHTIPAGTLESGSTFYIRVDVVTTLGEPGQSDVHEFTMSFATSVDVTGVVVNPIGGCSGSGGEDARVLPALRVAWTEVTPGGGETFLRYNIWRRRGDRTTVWVRVGVVTAVATVTFIDACVSSRVAYDYTVTWNATDNASGATLESTRQVPPIIGRLIFDRSYVHDVADRDEFATIYTVDVEEEEEQAVAFVQPWGRTLPTAQIGESQAAAIRLGGERGGHTFQRREWQRLIDLLERQRDDGATFCLRLGRGGRRYFVAWDRRQAIATRRANSTSALAFREIHFDETASI